MVENISFCLKALAHRGLKRIKCCDVDPLTSTILSLDFVLVIILPHCVTGCKYSVLDLKMFKLHWVKVTS